MQFKLAPHLVIPAENAESTYNKKTIFCKLRLNLNANLFQ